MLGGRAGVEIAQVAQWLCYDMHHRESGVRFQARRPDRLWGQPKLVSTSDRKRPEWISLCQICLYLLESLLHWGNVCVTWCHKAEKKRRACVFPHFNFWTSGLIFTNFVMIVVIGGHSRDVLNKFLPSGHGRRTNLRGGSSTSATYTTSYNAELQ